MQIEYVNRRGDRYYIFEGKTKTGKPKYFASKSATSQKGVPVDALPAEFEIYEHPSNSTVSVRRVKASRVLAEERELVDRLAVELSAYSCLQAVVDGDRIVIYTPDRDPLAAAATMAELFGSAPAGTAEWTRRNTSYRAEMRFTLADADRRLYTAQRYCYRGSVEDWIWIGGPSPLEPLAQKLVAHLGRESFYELM
jgi:hypothetical protein